jgi:hypothetical protein
VAALLLVACQQVNPTAPAHSDIVLQSRASGVVCFVKKTLSERLEFASADRAGATGLEEFNAAYTRISLTQTRVAPSEREVRDERQHTFDRIVARGTPYTCGFQPLWPESEVVIMTTWQSHRSSAPGSSRRGSVNT